MIHRPLTALAYCIATAALTAQQNAVAPLIERLADPAARDAAHAKLLELGNAAAAPLAAQLSTASSEHARACLCVLYALGPAGGAAVAELVDLVARAADGPHLDYLPEALTTLTELIPYRTDDDATRLEPTVAAAFRRWSQPVRDDRKTKSITQQRFAARYAFPRHQPLDALLALAQDRRAWVAEAAIEHLGALGPAAGRAVPVLRAVLHRPEPRILPTDQRVPLHRRAARALLAIDPAGSEVATARSVLAGTWSPPAVVRPLPPRVRQRLDDLLSELQGVDSARRATAVDNLVALGSLAAEPVGTLLQSTSNDDTLTAALEVLRRLGKDGAAAAPALATALMELSTTHTIAVVQGLVATLPGSEHTYVPPWLSSSVRRLEIQGHRIPGAVGGDFLNAFQDAMEELYMTLSIPAESSAEELRVLLDDASVKKRRRALEVIAMRGAACNSLVDKLGPMMTAAQPVLSRPRWNDDGRATADRVDLTDQIHRLAAAAILAAAPADHELVAPARERLALPAAK